MITHKNFKSRIPLLFCFKSLELNLKCKSYVKADFFSSTSNRKLCVRTFSTVLNLPRLYEQKEKTLLFFLDSLWDAEELLRSRYCLIMILAFKKYLDNTVHSSPIKARMDLNLVRKYIKLILMYLRNALVNDIDRVNSKFLIFFYFLTKTADFLAKSQLLSTRKLILRNLFFIFILSKGRARYFANLTVTNNVISKSYASFLPKIKYASSVFPTGLFLVLYSPYKSTYNLGASNQLVRKHKRFLQKLVYLNKIFSVRLKRKPPIGLKTSFNSEKKFFKKDSSFLILKKKFFLKKAQLLHSKIKKRYKVRKIKNFKFSFKSNICRNITSILPTKIMKNGNLFSSILHKCHVRNKLVFVRNFTKIFFFPFISKFVRRLAVASLKKLKFLVTSLNFKFRNRVSKTRLVRLLKISMQRRVGRRQLYKLFSYSFLKMNKQLFNSINKISVLVNSFVNFKHFKNDTLSFANFYKSVSYLTRKFKQPFLKKIKQFRSYNNIENKKKRLSYISGYFQNVSNSKSVVVLKKQDNEKINFIFSLYSPFFLLDSKNFLTLNLKKNNVPFFSNPLFSEMRILIFSKFFSFRKIFDIFFFYLNLVKLIKVSVKFREVRTILTYFPFFLHYGSQFIANNMLFFNFLNEKFIIFLDRILSYYKNSFNGFLKYRLAKLEQLYSSKTEKSSKSLLKKKQLLKFKYIKKTPVQTFVLERQNLRNLEFIIGNVKKLVMKFKNFKRRKSNVSFSSKLKRKRAILVKKRAERLLAIKNNRFKKKSISTKVYNSSLFNYFKTKLFKKKYAKYIIKKKKIVKKWKRRNVLRKNYRKNFKMSFLDEDLFSTKYLHRFHFRKRMSRLDRKRLRRKFFVNLLFFMRGLKQKRIAYNYYKIGKKSFKLAAMQKISNPFFLRLKLKRYLFSDKYKRIVNRFSFLNSSYGVKICIVKFFNFNSLFFNHVNFFNSCLDKYKIIKFSFLKTYNSFFYTLFFYFNNDLIINWLKYLKNSYLYCILGFFEFGFSTCLNDYLFLLKFLFYKSGCFFFF